ncbi:MAG: hypothetical protein IJY61_07730 [Candidatus Gastranaerophilales bacterium]|nr:hypothetical protein [Candidatus Gastranaerophilales bacterium]
MGQISVANLRLLAERNVANHNQAKNLAGLKKFTEGENLNIFDKQQELQNSLEKLAQAAKTIQT